MCGDKNNLSAVEKEAENRKLFYLDHEILEAAQKVCDGNPEEKHLLITNEWTMKKLLRLYLEPGKTINIPEFYAIEEVGGGFSALLKIVISEAVKDWKFIIV